MASSCGYASGRLTHIICLGLYSLFISRYINILHLYSYRANFTSYMGTAGDGIHVRAWSSCSQSGQPFSVLDFNGWWFAEDCTGSIKVQLNGCMTDATSDLVDECHDENDWINLWFSTRDDFSLVIESEMKIREL